MSFTMNFVSVGAVTVWDQMEYRGYLHWTTGFPIHLVRYPPCGWTAVLHLFRSFFFLWRHFSVLLSFTVLNRSKIRFLWKTDHFASVKNSVVLILMWTLGIIKLHDWCFSHFMKLLYWIKGTFIFQSCSALVV